MSNNHQKVCRDYLERPGCLGQADERYTMRFDDIGEEPLHWCSHCGPEVQAQLRTLERAFETRGPVFLAQFSDAIENVEAKRVFS